MDISSVNSDLIRGNVTTIILSSLWSSDRYGYDIMKEIETRSDSQYKLKQATLYNQLKRLEKQGLISSYDGAPDDTGGGKRRYFTLTAEGRNYLSKEKREYEYSRTILNKLISEQDFDFATPVPFAADELRPYAKRDEEEKPKVVYKEKVIEKKVFVDLNGNEITEEDAEKLRTSAEETAKRPQTTEERFAAALQNAQNNQYAQSAQSAQTSYSQPVEETKAEPVHEEPHMTIAEIFAKMDAEKAQKTDNENENTYSQEPKAVEQNAFNAFAGTEKEQDRPAQTARLVDLFNELEEKANKQIADEQAAKAAEEQRAKEENDTLSDADAQNADLAQQYVAADVTKNATQTLLDAEIDNAKYVANDDGTAYARPAERNDAFKYEKEDVNYKDFFQNLAASHADENNNKTEPKREKQRPSLENADLKTRLYAEGYKIRPYSRGNTSEYYSFNFIQSNVINRDTWLIVMAVFAVEMAIMWVSMYQMIDYSYFLSLLLIGCALCMIPFVICFINPSKRSRANFNFKLSLLNRSMLFVELTVVMALIGFFAIGANVNDMKSIMMSVVIPAIIFLNFPISSVVYWLLYRTKKYHVA